MSLLAAILEKPNHMKIFLKKLILGKPSVDEQPTKGAIDKRIRNFIVIWDNEQHDDIGIEKILRLFLAISQLVFLGTYIKQRFGKKGIAYQDLSVVGFVLFKVLFPLTILFYNCPTYYSAIYTQEATLFVNSITGTGSSKTVCENSSIFFNLNEFTI
jgi:hypothetical protein